MKLWKVSIESSGYDMFDAAIVAAETEDQARKTHPAFARYGYNEEVPSEWWALKNDDWWIGATTWALDLASVSVEYVGTAKPDTKAGVILASFNAG